MMTHSLDRWQGRAGQGRAGQGRAEQGRARQGREGDECDLMVIQVHDRDTPGVWLQEKYVITDTSTRSVLIMETKENRNSWLHKYLPHRSLWVHSDHHRSSP